MYFQSRNNNAERRARLACFVLDLFPNIMRCSVSHYMLKNGLSNKYCNNKRYPSVFTATELLLIRELPNVENFTTELCYKLISFEELLPTPSRGWGKFPDYKAFKVEDDIERIRHGINEIITINDDHCTEHYLVKFLYKLEQIIQRLQIALGTTSVYTIYKSVLIKNIDTAVILTELKNVGVIDSDVQHIKLQDRERYSKISAVITEFFPKILRNMIASWLSPLNLYNMCKQPGRKWNNTQELQINTLKSSVSYESLDLSMLYHLFRKFSVVPDPTQGWGKKPTKGDTYIADDIERIRLLRNECAHRCDTCIDQAKFDKYFLQFREITHRIAADYEHELTAIARDSLDPERQIELETALQKLEDIKERFKKSPVRYYWGNDFDSKIKDIRERIQTSKDILGQEQFIIEIELTNIDDAETRAKILNEFKKEINEGDYKIEFLGAGTGCLVLYAYISTETLTTDDILQTELSSFMTRILKKGMFGITSNQWIDAVIFPSEGNKELELNSSIAKSLRLQFNVKMDVFETDVSLESEIGACMQRTIKNLNGKGFHEEVTAIVHCVQSEDTEETHAMETSQLIRVDKIVEMGKKGTVVFGTSDKDGRTSKLTGQRPSKWTIPIDLQRQAEKIQKTVTRTTGSLLMTPIVCDGHVIDGMIDRRLINSQNIRKKTHTDFKKLKDDMVDGKKNEFRNLIMVSTFFKEREQCLTSLYRELLIHTVKTKQNLLCRLTLSYAIDRENQLPHFFEALSIAIEEKENECAKAIAWFITKIFFLANRVVLLDLIIDIWPALNCKCMKESEKRVPSSQFAIVVELDNKINKCRVPTKYFSVDIVYLDNEDFSEDNTNADKLDESNAEVQFADNKQITGLSARNLFAKHSKLTLMCKSSFHQHGIEKQCVHIFCRAKGLIPVGENHFPKFFCKLPTKVIQGSPEFMTKLRVGDMIGTDVRTGTLGGFVKVRGDTTFLTCLHVFMNAEELDADNISLIDDNPVLIKCYPAGVTSAASGKSAFVCGKIRDIAFITDNYGSTSIDAALVKVKKHIEICPTDYVAFGNQNISYDGIGLRSPFLNDSCVDYRPFCYSHSKINIATVSVGAITGGAELNCDIMENKDSYIEMEPDKLLQEAITHNTFSRIVSDVHMQSTFLARKAGTATIKRMMRKLYGQMHISNIPFAPGDSGKCIYVTAPVNGCIGMAIANHPKGGCIATPIMEILKHFNIRVNSH